MDQISPPSRPALPDGLQDTPVVAILRRLDFEQARRAGEAIGESGIKVVEVTMDSPDLLGYFARLQAELPSLTLGVGSVLSVAAAELAVDADARFLVCPHVNPDIIRFAAMRGVPVLPGAATATEVVSAWEAGAAAVKLFPANLLTPATVRALRDPLPHIPLVAVGGIDDRNARAFIDAGAVAVGVGAWLSGTGDAKETIRRAARLTGSIANGRPA